MVIGSPRKALIKHTKTQPESGRNLTKHLSGLTLTTIFFGADGV